MSGTTPVDNAIDTKTESITDTGNGYLPRGTVNLGRGSIAVLVDASGKLIVSIPRNLPPASRLGRGEEEE